MKRHRLFSIACLLLGMLMACAGCNKAGIGDDDYPIRPVPFTDVEIQDDFWAQRMKTNHEVTIPIALDNIVNDYSHPLLCVGSSW